MRADKTNYCIINSHSLENNNDNNNENHKPVIVLGYGGKMQELVDTEAANRSKDSANCI